MTLDVQSGIMVILNITNKRGGDGMKLTVKTAANGTIERDVANSREAVEALRALAADGVKCVRCWVK